MSNDIDGVRRRLTQLLVLGLPAAAFAPAGDPYARQNEDGSTRNTAHANDVLVSAIFVGLTCKKSTGGRGGADLAPQRLSFDAAIEPFENAAMRKDLAKRCAEDFAAGRTVKVGRAWLALSEVELCVQVAESVGF